MERILNLVWFRIFPAHFGGQKGIAGFNKALSQYFVIDCLCAEANTRLPSGNMQVLPNLPNHKWQFLNPFTWRKILRQYQKHRYRLVLIEFPYYGLIGYFLKKRGAVYFLHAHNIESQRFRLLGKWWWPVLLYYEKWAMRQANLVLFKTEQDKAYAIKHFGLPEKQAVVVPYGIEPAEVLDRNKSRAFLEQTHAIEPNELILLFAGTLDYGPNADAVTAIYQHLIPLLLRRLSQPFRVIICGRNQDKKFAYLKRYQNTNVVQAGFVQNMPVYFAGADVFINPVQKTFGVQTKIIDAISYGLNVVAFEDGGTGVPSYLRNQKLFLAENNCFGGFVRAIEEAVVHQVPTPFRFYDEFRWHAIASNFSERVKRFV